MARKILDYGYWITKFPLDPFVQNVIELRSQREKLKGSKRYYLSQDKFYTIINDISNFWRHIGYIIARLNENLSFYLSSDLTPKTPEELISESFPLDSVNLINVDLISLFLFIRILMDKVARLLHNILYGEKKPSLNRFIKWKEEIGEYKGYKIDQLQKIIKGASWFNELKDLRDHCVVHDGKTSAGVAVRHGREFGVFMQSFSGNKDIFYSLGKIQELIQNSYQFLENLNIFLCDNFKNLPIKTTRAD